jgi:hypothetical protein
LKDILLDATLAKAMTDCCVANTIVNCYYWCFEVANVVVKGKVRDLVDGKDIIFVFDGVDGNVS